MLKALFDRIKEVSEAAVPAQQITILKDGREYLVKGMDVKSAFIKPTASYYDVGTLTGLIEYLHANKDAADLSTLMAHVRSPKLVTVESGTTDPWLHRNEYVKATFEPKSFPFGKYMDQETFIIGLQTYFVPSEVTETLRIFAASVTLENNATFQDDGVSQSVTARVNVAKIANVQVPNPVELAPYRSFLEVEQPTSKFVFRIKKTDNGPEYALFEADGGNWSLDAMARVKIWLESRLPVGSGIVVLA